jgi:hypothetical protein
MRWDVTLMQTREYLTDLRRSPDWALIVLVAGFVAVLLSLAAYRQFLVDPFAPYKKAIAAAAIKRPDFNKPLKAIDSSAKTVNVVTLRTPRPLPLENRTFDIWVALESEARAVCKGAAYPVRKLQQSFGLPPVAAKGSVMTVLEVPREGLIRPCVVKGDVGTPACELNIPSPPPEISDQALREEYERLRLVAEQMWNSYRIGFDKAGHGSSDYPYTGFPFTGMGWAYNWSADSPNNVGVSEFVIKRNAVIKIVSEKKPAEFCAGN